ncbi:response regulator [Turicimonas sp. TL08]
MHLPSELRTRLSSVKSKILIRALYVLIIVYTVFVTVSMWRANQHTVDMFEYPYQVTRSVSEIQARLNEMGLAIPFIMGNTDSFEDIVEVLKMQEEEQNRSLEFLEHHFRGDPKEYQQLMQDFSNIREQRRKLALESVGKNKDEVLKMYQEQVAPYFDVLDKTLNKVSANADARSAEIKAQAQRLIDSVIVTTCLFGLLLVGFLWYVLNSEERAHKAIRHREQLFNILSHTVDEVFIIFNKKLKPEFVSSNSERVLGTKSNDLLRSEGDFAARLMEDITASLSDQINPGEAFQVREKDFECEGINRQFKIRFYPIQEASGEAGYIVVVSDETEALEQKRILSDSLNNALSASVAKSRFLSHVSHEIRTPMNAIIGMTTIALAKINDKPKVEDCLLKISQSSRHLLGLINDILDMSKIEENKLTIAADEFKFSEAVTSVVNLIAPQASEKNIKFDVVFNDEIEETLIGDAMRLNQVLINILSNAVKFTPEGGEVKLIVNRLWIKQNTIYLQFIVKDNGIGMSPEFQKKVFDPFEQASVKISSIYGGTGLGLSITRNLVLLMGGSISVQSQEGLGSEFSVELPFGFTNEENTAPHGLGEFKVLVVDDDIGTCEHACLILKRLGQNTEFALDGYKAVEMVKEARDEGHPYDVVFIDWKMPGIDGEETARRIRKLEGLNLLIIIMSAYDWAPIEESAREAGVNSFVAKPFFANSLRAALMSVDKEVQAKTALADPDMYDFTGKRVLLVEDNVFNQEVAQEFLSMAHVETDTAENGQIAVQKFIDSPAGYYDAILMDIQMPLMNGYEATKEIRASSHPDAASVPIIAMTANAFTEDVSLSLSAGMNAHLSKPLDMLGIYKLLEQTFKGKKEGRFEDKNSGAGPKPE